MSSVNENKFNQTLSGCASQNLRTLLIQAEDGIECFFKVIVLGGVGIKEFFFKISVLCFYFLVSEKRIHSARDFCAILELEK